MRCWATGCASTSPASLSTRRCFETWGWRRPSRSTISPTARGFRRRSSTICRRFGSARALSVACMRHIYSCRNIPVKVYIVAANIEERIGGEDAEDHDFPVVQRPGRRRDEVLRVDLQEREDPERRPDAGGNTRTAGEGPERVLPDRGAGIHGAERRAAVPLHRGDLSVCELRDAGGGRRAVGEALRGRIEGSLRLAERQVRPLMADHPDGTRPDASG